MNLVLVRTGTKYGQEYVARLVAGVRKHSSIKKTDLFTDQPDTFAEVRNVDVSKFELPGWWAKMAIFSPALRTPGDSIYLDLDTIVLGDLSPLETIAASNDFSICGSFVRQFGNLDWPCRYGSCVMTLRDGWGGSIWRRFLRNREKLLKLKRGDQKAIERLYPNAPLLQNMLPSSFFLNYRQLPQYLDGAPKDARMVIFGGADKPHTATQEWVLSCWKCA